MRLFRIFAVIFSTLAFSACIAELRRSDAELGINPQQARGRRIYDDRCDRCHEPYSTRDKKGHSMKSVLSKQFLPQSGLPANDQQVGDIIRYGRNNMPSFGRVLSQQEIDDLLAYMHTL